MTTDKMTLTFSRQQSFKLCRKRHWFEYEQGVRQEQDGRAIRMGSNGHTALEILKHGLGRDAAIESIRTAYAELPEAYDPVEWSYECETLERLLCAYVWRWQDDGLAYLANEQAFHLPLINPQTRMPSRLWEWAGKIDGIIRLEDSRQAVMEHKFLSEDLGSDSPLWRRLRVDHQISLYVLAARKLGFDVSSVLYDVIRKPTIKPTAVPILDSNGIKIVLDRDNARVFNKNGAPRQTASIEDGYALQTRPMTPEEWGDKLTADIESRPEFYFARVEVARLDQDLEECANELWDIQNTIRDAQVNNRHYRTCTKDTCAFCPFFDLCTTGNDLRTLPSGFARVSDLHPELRTSYAASSPAAVASEESSTAPAAIATGSVELTTQSV